MRASFDQSLFACVMFSQGADDLDYLDICVHHDIVAHVVVNHQSEADLHS